MQLLKLLIGVSSELKLHLIPDYPRVASKEKLEGLLLLNSEASLTLRFPHKFSPPAKFIESLWCGMRKLIDELTQSRASASRPNRMIETVRATRGCLWPRKQWQRLISSAIASALVYLWHPISSPDLAKKNRHGRRPPVHAIPLQAFRPRLSAT